MRKIIFTYLILFVCFGKSYAGETHEGEHLIDFKGRTQKVLYKYYVPENASQKQMPIVVCIGGLNLQKGIYAHSDPGECHYGPWLDFAEQHSVVMLGLGFLFDEDDWPKRQSYQYAQSWSGDALLEILNNLTQKYNFDIDQLYMWGVSAGAQYVMRFAQREPTMVRAVAAHAAGGYDLFEETISTEFLITVGELDNDPTTRLNFAKMIVAQGESKGIKTKLMVVPNIAHVQTEEQNKASRKFFLDVLNR